MAYHLGSHSIYFIISWTNCTKISLNEAEWLLFFKSHFKFSQAQHNSHHRAPPFLTSWDLFDTAEGAGKTCGVIERTVTFEQINQPMSRCHYWPCATKLVCFHCCQQWSAIWANSPFVLWETGPWLVRWAGFHGILSEPDLFPFQSCNVYPFLYGNDVHKLQVLFLLSWHCEQDAFIPGKWAPKVFDRLCCKVYLDR